MRLFSFHKVNRIYDRSKRFDSLEFCDALFEDLGVNVETSNMEVIERLGNTPFITVANHPYGHLDAISLIKTIGRLRPDYKITANFILMLIDTLEMHFISVNPYAKKGEVKASALKAISECFAHLREGHPLGFFPAGTISYMKWKGLKPYVEDVAWRETTVKVIQRAGVPIVPVHISGQNSWKFYSLGLLSWKARYLRLVPELDNKKGHTVRLTFGEPVMPGQIAGLTSKEAGGVLSRTVYSLKGSEQNRAGSRPGKTLNGSPTAAKPAG